MMSRVGHGIRFNLGVRLNHGDSKTISLRRENDQFRLKGQIVLPAEIRKQDAIEPGEEFDVERIDAGEYRLIRRKPPPNRGLVDWLLGCPSKGFFVPIDSESTDTL